MSRSATRELRGRSVLMWAGAVALALGGFILFAEYDAIRPGGSGRFLTLLPLVLLPILVCALGATVALIAAFPRHSRRVGVATVVACLMVAGVTLLSLRVGNRVRMRGFAALAERSEVLIQVIKGYEDAFGGAPESLEALVPEFIPAVPQTGMGAYPRYRYVVGRPGMYDGNPWVLTVFTPSGILDFDQFVYYPMQNYPAKWCGSRIERVRDWIYLHE